MGAPGGRRGRVWRVLRRVSLVLLAVVALVVGVLFTGIPQERAIEYFASEALGAIVEIDYGHALGSVSLKRVTVYATEADRTAGVPLLQMRGLEAKYSLFPNDDRFLREVNAYSLEVIADVRDGREPNYAFLLGRDVPEGRATDPRLLPVELNCTRVSLTYHADDFHADAKNIPIHVRIDDDGGVAASVGTQIASVRWWTDATTATQTMEWLDIHADLAVGSDLLEWEETVRWGERMAFGSSGSVDMSRDPWVVSIEDAAFAVDGDTLDDWARSFGLDVTARRLWIEEITGTYTLAETPSFEGTAQMQIFSPQLMEGDYLYEGMATIRASLSGRSDALNGDGRIEFSRGQRVDMEVRTEADTGNASITVHGWSKDDLLDAIPASFRESVAPLGFDGFSSEAKGAWSADGFNVTMRGESAGEVDAVPAISWAVDASGPMDGTRPVEGHLEARLGESLVQAAGFYNEAGGYSGEAIVEEVEIRPWLAFFTGPDNAESVSGTIAGTLSARAKSIDAPLTITPKFTLRDAGYSEVRVDEVTLEGNVVYDRTEESIQVSSLRAETVDGLTSVALTDWRYGIVEGTGSGAFQAGADLGLVSELFDLPEVYGAATVDGNVTGDGELWRAELTVFSDFVGYGDLLLTLGGNVTGGGSVTLDPETGGVRIGELALSVGEGTTARLQRVEVAMNPLSLEGELNTDSDLRLLIDMEYLQDVEGSLQERSTFRYDEAGVSFDWNIEMDVNRLVLAEEAGAAEGLSLSGAGTYRDGLDGSGELRATLLSAAGGSIRNVIGPATFRGSQMRIEQATGTIFDGLIVAHLDIGLLETGLPIFLRSEFSDIDLSALTEEVQPPNTELTGIANGTLSAEAKDGEVVGFELDARSDRNLSVNRSLVADLLTSEGFVAGLGERLADRTMDRILGEAPRRPFDSGRLYLYLAEEKLSGTAELRSVQTGDYRGLNLNVSLDVDAKSLQDALLLLEQARLDSMEL